MQNALDEALEMMGSALAILDREGARFAAVHLQHAISVATAERDARASALRLDGVRRDA